MTVSLPATLNKSRGKIGYFSSETRNSMSCSRRTISEKMNVPYSRVSLPKHKLLVERLLVLRSELSLPMRQKLS